mmetsp:Transcript_28017/g.61739  ORF Transcript_28017/g.61739 Transcript_28017/m.61739 type:complete len:80 (+) Transcript_28017:606-845(+)
MQPASYTNYAESLEPGKRHSEVIPCENERTPCLSINHQEQRTRQEEKATNPTAFQELPPPPCANETLHSKYFSYVFSAR